MGREPGHDEFRQETDADALPVKGRSAGADERRAFGLFLLCGGTAAGVNLVVRFVLSRWLIFEVAVTIAYLVGMAVAYLLNRRFVFTGTERAWWNGFARFALVNLISFTQVILVSGLFVRVIFPAISFRWRPEDVGHFLGVISPIATSYYGHKHFSFGSRSTVRS